MNILDQQQDSPLYNEPEQRKDDGVDLTNIGSKERLNTSNQDSSVGSNSQQKLKMDLSHVSFLKPHVINPVVYNLAHEGHSRKQLMKTDVIKSIE